MGSDSEPIPAIFDLSTYDFTYPEELVAKEPLAQRDAAKLLVYDRATEKISHYHFTDLPKLLGPDVSLVFNHSKVFLARVNAEKIGGTAQVEVLFVRQEANGMWACLMKPGRRVHVGQSIRFPDGSEATLKEKGDAVCLLEWNHANPFQFFADYGALPLPPYLSGSKATIADYQTVFANPVGSAAAPTAGLHFTDDLMQNLKQSHPLHYVCLHVGLGTFKPIQTTDIRTHTMHEEYIEMSESVAKALNEWKAQGKKICAVGTTSLRTLESTFHNGKFVPYVGNTGIFMYPGHGPQATDMLITNFHTPQSSLLVLIASMVGDQAWRRIYQEAIDNQYRLFSFGDGMLIV